LAVAMFGSWRDGEAASTKLPLLERHNSTSYVGMKLRAFAKSYSRNTPIQ